MRENRTITVDFRDEATFFRLIADGKAFEAFDKRCTSTT